MAIRSVLAGAVFLSLAPPAGAQIQVPSCQILAQDDARFSNAVSSQANLTVTSGDGSVRLGRNGFFEDGTSISGAFVAIGNGSSVDDVNADTLQLGRNAVVRGDQGDFQPSTFVCPAPPTTCSGQGVEVRKNGSQSLAPGSYAELRLQNGATVTLAAGHYTFCSIRTGKHATIEIAGPGQTTIDVAGDVDLENDTAFGPIGGAATPILNVLGGSVKFAMKTIVRAFVQAPDAELNLGKGATFIGAACAASVDGSRLVQLICAPDVPTTTTSTSSTTTTSSSSMPPSSSTSTTTTTTTTPPQCGNGVLDPGEECDTTDFGGRTCLSSPSGALLCTGECTIDFTQCPGDASTTTTSSVPTTTSSSSTIASTTSTSTTTTTQAFCGNGVLDPGEECDTSDFGGRTCQSSPSGALLCTGECTIDFSQCPGDASTTTTSSVPSTSTSSSTQPTTSSTSQPPATTTSSTSTSLLETTSTSTSTSSSSSTSLEPTTTSTSSSTTTTLALSTLDFLLGAPGGICGQTQDGTATKIKDLTCGGLNIGAGGSIVAEGPTPDGAISRYSVACSGSSCTVSAYATAPALNTADPDCSTTGCNFGTPLPIPNPGLPTLSTCVLNTYASPGSGTFDLSAGTGSLNVDLSSDIYLTGNLAQPCPRCSVTGTPANPGTGTCDRGPRAGLTCVTTSSTGVTRDCPTGGTDAGHPCTPGGGACIDGSHVGVIGVNLSPLTTGTATSSKADGLFCTGQTHAGCFGSGACRTITENGAAAGSVTPGVPAAGTLASTFCIAATGNGLVDASADLPGPGAVSLRGTFEVN